MGPVHQEPTKVAVAALGYRSEKWLSAGGVLLRDEPQPRCKMSRAAERTDVYRSDDRGGGDRSNSRDLHQALAGFARTVLSLDLTVKLENAVLDLLPLRKEQLHQCADPLRYTPRLRLLQLGHLPWKRRGPESQMDAKLREVASELPSCVR